RRASGRAAGPRRLPRGPGRRRHAARPVRAGERRQGHRRRGERADGGGREERRDAVAGRGR
ncbi:MAG: hypothetical protein F4Y03_03975, partial [Alphaproteobacteria bacterium]|nr:hypothetical protein [Alphaproteobacteria bacterium]